MVCTSSLLRFPYQNMLNEQSLCFLLNVNLHQYLASCKRKSSILFNFFSRCNPEGHVFNQFFSHASLHCRGGQWNSGGNCDGETRPITDDTYLSPYPWMTKVQESVISEMKSPVFYLNITKMTDYRKDGHPSIFRQPVSQRRPGMFQDCSHWRLPGVPDSRNELLYATMIKSHKFF